MQLIFDDLIHLPAPTNNMKIIMVNKRPLKPGIAVVTMHEPVFSKITNTRVLLLSLWYPTYWVPLTRRARFGVLQNCYTFGVHILTVLAIKIRDPVD